MASASASLPALVRRIGAASRRAVDTFRFMVPACAGVAIAILGVRLQEMHADEARSRALPGRAAAAQEAADAPVAPVEVRDLLGVVVASDVVEIAARAEGRLTAVPARLGDRVERGAVLASIDDRDLKDELAAARAAMKALEAERDKAASELDEARERTGRSERLSHLISAEELARVRYAEKYAVSRLQATLARRDEQATRVAILARSIEEAQVRAPFDGMVAARYVGPGATVSPGTPIARLVSAGDVLVRFAIPETSGAHLRVGMPVTVDVGAAALSGKIDKLAPEVDAASRMIVAEAHVRIPDGLSQVALAGRAARVHVGAAADGEESAP